jgi:hypothetical protein
MAARPADGAVAAASTTMMPSGPRIDEFHYRLNFRQMSVRQTAGCARLRTPFGFGVRGYLGFFCSKTTLIPS